MTDQYVFDFLLPKNRVVNVQGRTTGVTKDVLDAFVVKRADKHVTARQSFSHPWKSLIKSEQRARILLKYVESVKELQPA
jgi:hypothetical protein